MLKLSKNLFWVFEEPNRQTFNVIRMILKLASSLSCRSNDHSMKWNWKTLRSWDSLEIFLQPFNWNLLETTRWAHPENQFDIEIFSGISWSMVHPHWQPGIKFIAIESNKKNWFLIKLISAHFHNDVGNVVKSTNCEKIDDWWVRENSRTVKRCMAIERRVRWLEWVYFLISFNKTT